MEKHFQFIFYKFYGFYQKRWPNHDPPEYAQGIITFVLSFELLIIYYFLIEILGLHELMEGNSKFLIIIPFIIATIFNYRYFLHDNRYMEFIKKKKYQRDIYHEWKGNMIVAIFLFIPVVMGILCTWLYLTLLMEVDMA